ncbi:MAG: dihydrofolate reductase family protein [Pyrinomonadaceae bacterium]
MRKVTFGTANSLDNFIARENGDVDWLMWSDEVTPIMSELWAKIDTILMGRKTFEAALKNAPEQSENEESNIKTYVFSRTLKKGDHKNVEIISDNAAEFIRELKNQDGSEICLMGGGDFARTLFEAGLIDEIEFNIHPVLLGSGVPLFLDMNKQISLELIECKPLKNGCVYVSYKVK